MIRNATRFVCRQHGCSSAPRRRSAFAQFVPDGRLGHTRPELYAVAANITYLTASGFESKLDMYRRRDVQTPQPTLVFYHGGGWIGGTKEASFMSIMPWLEMGWNVVNVEHRMARVAEAPAAVEDAICALRYVVNNAKNNNIDPAKIVVSGESAGGHLALAVGMMPATSGFTSICAGGGFTGNETAVPKVAAIINWYGITDVNDLLAGANARSYTVQWIGSGRDRDDVAKSVSPLTYVRAGLPPILSIQGDAESAIARRPPGWTPPGFRQCPRAVRVRPDVVDREARHHDVGTPHRETGARACRRSRSRCGPSRLRAPRFAGSLRGEFPDWSCVLHRSMPVTRPVVRRLATAVRTAPRPQPMSSTRSSPRKVQVVEDFVPHPEFAAPGGVEKAERVCQKERAVECQRPPADRAGSTTTRWRRPRWPRRARRKPPTRRVRHSRSS